MQPGFPNDSGSGEFAVGFNDDEPLPPMALVAQLDATILEVRNAVAAVHVEALREIDACVNACKSTLGECTGCLLGSIDRTIDDVIGLRRKIEAKVIESIDRWAGLGAAAVVNVIPPDMFADSANVGDGANPVSPVAVSPLPVSGLPDYPARPFAASSAPTASGPAEDGAALVPAESGPPQTWPQAGPTKTSLPCPIVEQLPSTQCSVPNCAAGCAAAGGSFSYDEHTGYWVCKWADGSATFCQGAEGSHCIYGVTDAYNFVYRFAALGWTIIHPDPDNPATVAVHNAVTGETIYVQYQGEGCFKTPRAYPTDPMPRPHYAPADAVRVVREDMLAIWIDAYGNTYGPLVDVSACPFENGFGYYLPGSLWLEFPDGKSGWLNVAQTDPVKLCVDTTGDQQESPTIDTAEDWIDAQDDPTEWEVIFSEDENMYVIVNNATGEVVHLEGETPIQPDDEIGSSEPSIDEFTWDEEAGVEFV